MSSVKATSYLPYHEPDIVTILVQSSFLLVLNIVNHVFDNLIFCGLIGQIFIGVAWGTPGGKLFDEGIEHVVVQLGYLGLILLVYEGGLQTKFSALKANAFLSAAVALTGIAVPIALSFSLLSLASATPLQAFAAGAALCSTSLGTTFTILNTSGLTTTRLGVVLTSGAMLDDVVGLVMVQVISNLGGGNFTPITVVRPIVVSIGLGVAVLVTCRFIAKSATLWYNSMAKARKNGLITKIIGSAYAPVLIHTAILLGLVTGATYAGTSNLFAAYLAGASISWWDSEVPKALPPATLATSGGEEHSANTEGEDEAPSTQTSPNAVNKTTSSSDSTSVVVHASTSGVKTFDYFYGSALHRVFKPLFFASIGFAIPITKLFSGPIIWRGIIYTILMLLGKLVTGLWLVRLSGPIFPNFPFKSKIKAAKNMKGKKVPGKSTKSATNQTEGVQLQGMSKNITETSNTTQTPATANEGRKRTESVKTKHINRPLSLYPAAMLGTAMTARGEIGFLIASLAETTGVFSSTTSMETSQSSEIYLITTWAILLCTIIGPLSIGTLVKRVRRLERDLAAKGGNGRTEGPLGIWGVF
ncbi:hypothetical protein SS1G_05771 [Sclerotinia sclerotiorum 1980 UF-70]|uniref:Cation/H+ exchanger transmembrane domain-containing protein n=2 Tax=Sclerotinia sclerotiorum (strain ATCC 18683 / 1980 / Ss-1) TaxID=665079 RepID=A7EKC4_SCLS1|nr:hypothetical protein SS1G_05771 [Sclerotinia sclerotiorum 1980 UF-70]APA09971.1 hypothetical protein sscle_05g047410 [Sclerotinia sclerotiorum 1980 UF-70]EDO03290.1 hypothetical protein SS1G_05771 [Sclerotinia sclerotiorum 1980 UF-70]